MKRSMPMTLLRVALPLWLLFCLVQWLWYGAPLTASSLGGHAALALAYTLWHWRNGAWFDRLAANDYAGWQRVVQGGQMRFLMAYGLSSRGMMLACLVVGVQWVASGAIPSTERLLTQGMLWAPLGIVLAYFDWLRMEQGATAGQAQ